MATISILDATSTPQTAALVTNTGQTTAANSLPVVLASDSTPVTISGYDSVNEKLLVGTARERFFDNFPSFNTSTVWDLVQSGSGMTAPTVAGGVAVGAAPYITMSSGTSAGERMVYRSQQTFSAPLDLRVQISASQRIANNTFRIGFLEVNDSGTLVTSTDFTTAPEILNARNGVMLELSGTVATTGALRLRAAGSTLDNIAAAYGTGFTTLATGTGPNFLSATTYGLAFERDRVNTRAWGQNVLTNTGGQFASDRVLPDPTKKYKLYFMVENGAVAPASSTDWRIHLVNMLDATRFDVSPRNGGTTDQSKAFPVLATISSGTVTTVSTVTAVTGAGTPAVPATPYFVNSLATTNGALILTGTSGLQAFYATNTGATAAFVKLYNKATAPTVGTDVPEMIINVPAAVSGVPGAVSVPTGFNAFRFPLGLGIAITGGSADSDTTAVAAGQVKVKLSRTV